MRTLTKLFLGSVLLLNGAMTMAHSDGAYEHSDFFKGMDKNDKAAIMMVHFGTTFDDTRALTIDRINEKVQKKFQNIPVKEAYTSRIIMRRLKDKGIDKPNPEQVLNELKDQGYTHVLVQGTNIMNGIENENLNKEIEKYSKNFKDIRVGNPLLTTPEDYKEVAEAIVKKIGPLKPNQGVVLVGHGTEHFGGSAYPMMDYVFAAEGHDNFVVGTVEGYPEFDDVVNKLKKQGIKDVILMPFMFVAGDHANNDIAGDWNEDLQKAGFTVSKVIIAGLGQNEDIQEIYTDHIDFMIHHKPVDMAAKKVHYSNEKD
ncbi:sirohydrochlorin cobaltochelatase [Fusobacterium sp.]|uniref:sirohydrochlorin cobaltochelatase n=1 Tax=Fusobacterium sp. TaxID=68766 RepID=UPI00396C6C0B